MFSDADGSSVDIGLQPVECMRQRDWRSAEVEAIRRCARCILPASLPSVILDSDGVCNHCHTYDAWLATFGAAETERRAEFEELARRAKERGHSYDVLIPLSGGKDSTYALYLCSKVYDLKCLCVTFDNGYLSQFGKDNIANALKATGAHHIVYRMDRDLLVRLYGLFLSKCGNFCSICNRGIAVAIRMAAQAFSVPLVVCGNGAPAAYLSDGLMPELQEGGETGFVRNVLNGEPLEEQAAPLFSYPVSYTTLDSVAHAIAGALPFRPVERAFWALHARARRLLQRLRLEKTLIPRGIHFQDYIDVPLPVMRQTLEKEMGWRAPADKFNHVDCLIEPVKVYIQTLRFPELSRHTVRNSGLVRSGQMTKEAALAAEQECLGDGWVPGVLGQLLEDVDMTEDEFFAAVQDWRTMDGFREQRAFPDFPSASRST